MGERDRELVKLSFTAGWLYAQRHGAAWGSDNRTFHQALDDFIGTLDLHDLYDVADHGVHPAEIGDE